MMSRYDIYGPGILGRISLLQQCPFPAWGHMNICWTIPRPPVANHYSPDQACFYQLCCDTRAAQDTETLYLLPCKVDIQQIYPPTNNIRISTAI